MFYIVFDKVYTQGRGCWSNQEGFRGGGNILHRS
uniref:Uncharacterized protein n=1 Tax=Arundo donax TaxID=35708 RepID=A0A0A8YYN4_ARUDO